ncbi:ProQ/FINO family protein [Succinivibrio sp.]|uniref:ProQ/FINO family protein n=1 Tax=Succinivibrio sp. TaxID=2053619 RepID=UPI00345D1671|nr:hypothetical protein [Succinivibrio sp.]
MKNSKQNKFELFFLPKDQKTVNKFKIFLDYLIKLYPNLFTSTKKNIKPLALNIRYQIRDEFKKQNLDVFLKFWNQYNYTFLRWYTHNNYYFLACIRNKYRYNLDGSISSELTVEHKDYACSLLKANCEKLFNRYPEKFLKNKFILFASRQIMNYENSKKDI